MLCRTFKRGVCLQHQRHPVADAITAALPLSTTQSSVTDQYGVTNIMQSFGDSFRGHWRPGYLSLMPARLSTRSRATFASDAFRINNPSIIKSTSLASFFKAGTSYSIVGKHAVQIRTFQSVGDYHNVADETLNSIQDVVEDYLEEYYDTGLSEKEEDIPEVNFSSGVLTMYLPSHGTWVINKQTPNQQLWWSSPISGPRRYEYDKKTERWVYSRVVDEEGTVDNDEVTYEEEDTLGGILNKEFEGLFGKGLGVDDDFYC
mmetsp:Transcript_22375/g.54198  ORF Transcript_22375/g.54198 Transcript_22375/m.54198 type:complete len:260 (+) Transcript_22375:140-919(+)